MKAITGLRSTHRHMEEQSGRITSEVCALADAADTSQPGEQNWMTSRGLLSTRLLYHRFR